MTKMKRTLALALAFILVVCLSVAGTMAYLSYSDGDHNTMTMGKVEIEQIEQQRNEDGSGLEDFQQDQPMLPAVYDELKYDDEKLTIGDDEYNVFTNGEDINNVIDKIVTVKNTGDYDAYIRTLVAFEHTDPNNDTDFSDGIAWKVHNVYNGSLNTYSYANTVLDNFEIDDTYYSLVCFVYPKALEAGKTSAPSLLQVFFDKTVNNDDLTAVGEEYDILVLSQAVQAEGFETAEDALNEAFGEIKAENVDMIVEWFKDNCLETTAP